MTASRRNLTRVGIAAAVALILSNTVWAQDADNRVQVSFSIPQTQPLGTALRALVSQASTNIMFDESVVAGKTAAPLQMQGTLNEALKRLLKDTGLEWRFLNDATVVVGTADTLPPIAKTTAVTPDKGMTLAQNTNTSLAVDQTSERQENNAVNADASSGSAKEVAEVVVTGTHIRGSAAPTGSPVVVIDRETIERSGYTTTTDVVRMLPQNFQGSFDEMSRFGNVSTTDNANNTTGASGANLRGLGADATLTLLDGQRMSATGAFSAAGDLSLIPLSAVDRVEVMLDGASAIYGSDAVGGVVNVILKKTYSGAQTLVERGDAARGSYGTLRLAQTLGRAWGSGGALVSYEYRDQDPLYQRERSYITSPSQTAAFVPPSRVNSVMARVNQQVAPRVLLSLNALAAKRQQDSAAIVDGVTLGFESQQISGTAAADITLGGTWSSTLSTTVSDAENTMGNEVLALNGGSYTLTDNRAWDVIARFSGRLATLPGGELRLAFGGEHHVTELGLRYETPNLGTPPPGGKYDRDSNAAYAELSVPLVGADNAFGLVRSLALSLAGRHEEYSDFGTSDTYKLGLSWTLVKGLALRATHGTSFRAPGLTQLYGDNTSSIQRLSDPLSSTGSSVVFTKTGANRDLTAEEAVSSTIGFDYSFERIPGLRASATYFETDYTDRIELPRPSLAQPTLFAAFLLRNPTPQQIADAYAKFPVASNPSGFTPADIQVIRDSRTNNTASAYIRGFDLSLNHRLSTSIGVFSLQASASHFLDYRVQLIAGGPSSDRRDWTLYPTSWKTRGSLGWDLGGWSASAAVNTINSHLDRSTTVPAEIDAFTTVDLRLAYQFQRGLAKDLQVSLAARNLLDKDPPLVRSVAIGYDPANASPLGRVLTLGLRKDW